MPVTKRARRHVRSFGGPAEDKRGTLKSNAAPGEEEDPAGSLFLEALAVAINQSSDVRQWYTSPEELQWTSLELCVACRSAHTRHLRVDGSVPASLLAPADAPGANSDRSLSSRVPRLRARRVTWHLSSLTLLSDLMETFDEVEELHLGSAFEGSLDVRAWPARLRRIQFGMRSCFNQPVVGVAWPASLQKLHFGNWFNQPVEGVRLPASLKELRFFQRFNQPIKGVDWPASLQILMFGNAFNQPIGGVVWPSSLLKLHFQGEFNQSVAGVKWPRQLQQLTFGNAFNQPIGGVVWPSSLLKLHFQGEFNQPVAGVKWPRQLQQLTFGHAFNQPVGGVTWPTQLQQLTFGHAFNQPIDACTWPPSLEDLSFGEDFNQSFQGCTLPTLRRLQLTGTFPQTQRNLGSAMPSLEMLTLDFEDSLSVFHVFRGIEWPSGLAHLTILGFAILQGALIPPSVSVDHFG